LLNGWSLVLLVTGSRRVVGVNFMIIEAIMYFSIGFLSATLIGISIAPLIHGRAVRLTRRRLENAMPQSMAEIVADKDLQRAEFAVATRRLEMTIERLRESNTGQLAEIGRKDDIINRFKIDRQTHQVEMLLLKGEVASLREQHRSAANAPHIAQSRTDEIATMRVTPAEAPGSNAACMIASPALTAEPFSVGPITTKETVLKREGNHSDASLVPLQSAVTRAGDPMVGPPVPERTPEPGTASTSRVDPSIHVSPADHFALERTGPGTRLPAIGLVAILIGICGLSWTYYRDASPPIASWTQAIIGVAPTTMKAPPAPPVDKAFVPAPVQQIEELSKRGADLQNEVEQSATTQAETPSKNPGPVRGEQPKEALLSPAPQPQPKLVPVPETPPTTIPGWIVREVINGTAVVQGPNGIWRVTRGDTLPGAGRVDSIVRWGHRWIVATNRGLISTP
jgi:hypothetical protein